MSRRKDRDRYLALRHQNPDYKGFRGLGNGPSRVRNVPLVALNCSVCGKKRNVAAGIAEQQRESYICITCESEREPAISSST